MTKFRILNIAALVCMILSSCTQMPVYNPAPDPFEKETEAYEGKEVVPHLAGALISVAIAAHTRRDDEK